MEGLVLGLGRQLDLQRLMMNVLRGPIGEKDCSNSNLLLCVQGLPSNVLECLRGKGAHSRL